MKTNYFYIDESGAILNDSSLFIHGCIMTDTPDLLSDTLSKLKKEIEEDLYFDPFIEDFKKEGFHAVDNHFDIRASFYRSLISLNWRAYFVVIKKDSDYFRSLSEKEEYEIFNISINKLIRDRIINHKGEKNIFLFETIEVSGKSLKNILKDIFDKLGEEHICEYHVLNKEDDINMGIVDYITYILNQLLKDEKKRPPRMLQNFEIFEPKIALIHFPHSGEYLSSSEEEISLDKLFKSWWG